MSINVAKQRRRELLDKLDSIRSFIAASANKNESRILQEYINEFEKEINGRKYGLLFEEHREAIDEVLEQSIPVLTENKKLYIHNGGEMNFIIEGDNLAALKILEKTHSNLIDLIIIDPPYNRGKNDFRYDDNFLNANDNFPHSMWLSFMEKRLKCAKKLLSKEGYILINIDENELAQLKLLCDEIFGEKNFVGIYMWEKTSTPPALSRKVRKKLEYILCYAKSMNASHQFSQGMIDGGDAPLLNTANELKELVFPKGSVRFMISDGVYEKANSEKVSLTVPVIVEKGLNANELKLRGRFKWVQSHLNKEVEQGTYFIIKSTKFAIRYQRTNITKVKTPQNLINSELGVDTNEAAAKEIEALKLPSFEYPKPSSLYSFLINMVNTKKNMTILDFFAGSGTTGDAVLQVNRDKKTKHRFILCTNNQDNICRGTTYERIKRIIEKENYEACLKYFKVEFISENNRLYYEYVYELLDYMEELVELENGIDINGESVKVLVDEEAADVFIDHLEKSSNCKKIYIGTDVLLDGEQVLKLKDFQVDINYIPDYYYGDLER